MKTTQSNFVRAAGLLVGTLAASAAAIACNSTGDGEAGGVFDADARGTQQELTIPATVPAAPGVYAILASGKIGVGDRGRVTAGHIGSNSPTGTDAVTANSDSRVVVDGATVGRRVVLKDRARAGGVFATQVSAPFAQYVSLAPFAAPPAVPSVSPVTAGTTVVTVNSGQTLTRAAGSYGAVTVNGTLKLSGGIYNLASLTLGPDAVLSADADAEVRVAGRVVGADRAKLLGPTTTGASGLRIVIAGATDTTGGLTMGNDSRVTALVLSKASVKLGERSVNTGAIAATNVTLGNDSSLAFAGGFECNADASCADTNPCTVDACTNGKCTHDAAPNGTSCSDGNACTTGPEACQSGACVPGPAVVCAALDQCHDAGTCNPSTGACSNPAKADGASCDDGNACTSGDSCTTGACTSGGAVTCDDGMFCNGAESCNPASGCQAGVPPIVSDGVGCTVDSCDNGSASVSHTADPGACGVGFVCDATLDCIPDVGGTGGSSGGGGSPTGGLGGAIILE